MKDKEACPQQLIGHSPIFEVNKQLKGYFFELDPGLKPEDCTSRDEISLLGHPLSELNSSALSFINFDMTEIAETDPKSILLPSNIVLGFKSKQKAIPQLVRKIEALRILGNLTFLDVTTINNDQLPLMKAVDFLVLDAQKIKTTKLAQTLQTLNKIARQIIIKNVNTQEIYLEILQSGSFEMSGHYPINVSPRDIKIEHNLHPNILKLMVHEDIHLEKIVQYIQRDMSLMIYLFRKSATQDNYAKSQFLTLSEILSHFGTEAVKTWVLEAGKMKESLFPKVALQLAYTRAFMMSQCAQRQDLNKDSFFQAGILSAMGFLYQNDLGRVLNALGINKDIAQQLQTQTGYFGNLLKQVTQIENLQPKEKNNPQAADYSDVYLNALTQTQFT